MTNPARLAYLALPRAVRRRVLIEEIDPARPHGWTALASENGVCPIYCNCVEPVDIEAAFHQSVLELLRRRDIIDAQIKLHNRARAELARPVVQSIVRDTACED